MSYSGLNAAVHQLSEAEIEVLQKRLIEACQVGCLDTVKACVDAGADATAASHQAYQVAAIAGHLEILNWLFDESWQLYDYSESSCRLLQHAAEYGHLEIIQQFSQDVQYTFSSYDTYQTFVRAAETGWQDIVQWLLEHSREPIDFSRDSFRVLFGAAYKGQFGVIAWLLREAATSFRKNPVTSNVPVPQFDLSVNNYGFFDVQPIKENLSFLKWLLFESGYPVDASAVGEKVAGAFLNDTTFQEFQWLIANSHKIPQPSERPAETTNAMSVSIAGNLALVRALETENFDAQQWIIQHPSFDIHADADALLKNDSIRHNRQFLCKCLHLGASLSELVPMLSHRQFQQLAIDLYGVDSRRYASSADRKKLLLRCEEAGPRNYTLMLQLETFGETFSHRERCACYMQPILRRAATVCQLSEQEIRKVLSQPQARGVSSKKCL